MDIVDVRTPFLGANDDLATVIDIPSSYGAQIEVGQDLVVLETTKTSIVVTAETGGIFYHRLSVGTRVRTHQVIGLLSESVMSEDSVNKNLEMRLSVGSKIDDRFTVKALKLAKFAGIAEEIVGTCPEHHVIDQAYVENFLTSSHSSVDSNLGYLTARAVDSTALIFGFGHGNVTVSKHLLEAGLASEIIFFDYKERKLTQTIPEGVVLPRSYAFEFVRLRFPLLVHVPYSVLKDLRPYLDSNSVTLISYISSNSYISASATIGRSVVIMAGAVIEPGVVLSDFCYVGPNVTIGAKARVGVGTMILNSASVAHDAVIGDGCLIADGSRVAGRAVLGNEVHLGLNSCINAGCVVDDSFRLKSGGLVF